MPAGSVIIPAHDEAKVISMTLGPLAEAVREGQLEVIVVCNGCLDDTARVARTFAGVRVIELSMPSKTAALNAGDDAAEHWPRAYLDADIRAPAISLIEVLGQLQSDGPLLAARPPRRYDTSSSSALVSSFYRARSRVSSLESHLWGAGVYALSRKGHRRFDRFPDVIADDLFIDLHFRAHEKAVIDTAPVAVTAPVGAGDLIRILRRVYRGKSGIDAAGVGSPPTSSSSAMGTLRDLVRSVDGPGVGLDAAVYAAFVTYARWPGHQSVRWGRDESSRRGPVGGPLISLLAPGLPGAPRVPGPPRSRPGPNGPGDLKHKASKAGE